MKMTELKILEGKPESTEKKTLLTTTVRNLLLAQQGTPVA